VNENFLQAANPSQNEVSLGRVEEAELDEMELRRVQKTATWLWYAIDHNRESSVCPAPHEDAALLN